MKISDLPISTLAYIGDAVYELLIRMAVLNSHTGKSGAIHKRVIDLVNASAQTVALSRIAPFLDEAEASLVKRAANYSVPSARQVNPSEYRQATGFEALLGYLYLNRNYNRLQELITKAQVDLDFTGVHFNLEAGENIG